MIKNLKTKLLVIVGIVVFLISVLLICYPMISSCIISKNQSDEIINYNDNVDKLNDSEIKLQLKKADEYNKKISENAIFADPFNSEYEQNKDYKYENLLKINGSDIMASIEIPAINIKLPIYHGTSDEVLQKGIGHLQGSSLPIGGKGTHAILTGHSGLSSSKMFTDIDQLSEGDIFYIHILNKTLAYKIDQIKIILPSEVSDLKISPNEDYVSLVTCTPHGVNSHRLLVRGTRIAYDEAQKIEKGVKKEIRSNWFQEYMNSIIVGIVIFAVIVVIFIIAKRFLKYKKKIK